MVSILVYSFVLLRVSDPFYFDADPDPRIRVEKNMDPNPEFVKTNSNIFLIKFLKLKYCNYFFHLIFFFIFFLIKFKS